MNMVLAIASPVRGGSKLLLAGSHVVGSTLGGVVVALLLWILLAPARTLAPPAAAALFVAVALVAVATDLGAGRVRFRKGRLIPSTWWVTARPGLRAGLYGAWLGAGLLTFVPVALTYVVFALGAATVSGFLAVAIGAAFGAARGGMTALAGLSGPDRVSRILYRSGRFRLVQRVGSLAGILALAVAVGVSAYG